MAHIDGEIVINRPVEEVFDFVADERNEPRYNPRMLRAEQITPEPIGPGTRFGAESKSMGRTVKMVIEITTYERPHRLASSTRLSAMDINGTLTFDPLARGHPDALVVGTGAARCLQADDPDRDSHGSASGGNRLGQPQASPGGAAAPRALGSARSLIPRSIFWLITKLTAWTGSTMSGAHGRLYA